MIYLDNAATTLQKPQSVSKSVLAAISGCGSAGRGGHKASMKAAHVILECREEAAKLFCVDNPERIVFTLNATHALNIAIKTRMGAGGVAVVSGMEHNAVMRPLYELINSGTKTRVAHTPLFEPEMAVHSFEQATLSPTNCVICTHISNAFGYVLPILRIDEICAVRGIPLIVDASQSAGCAELDVSRFRSNVCFCMPGHKGLLGPQGTGILICPKDDSLTPLIAGGTGSFSADAAMPDFLPDRLEAGTHNTPGIAGLCKGIKYVRSAKVAEISKHSKGLISEFIDMLTGVPGIRVHSSTHMFCQSGLVSLTVCGKDPEIVADTLGEMGIAVRAGLHCAPLAHKTAGTYPTGTVRVSVSAFSTRADIRAAARALRKIV